MNRKAAIKTAVAGLPVAGLGSEGKKLNTSNGFMEPQKTTFINRNFLLKVYGLGDNGQRINTLVGVSGLVQLIGVELANKFVTRALESGKDSTKCKLRRGLQVTLYFK